MPDTDPITLEIIQSSLQAISDEMFAAFRKTAMSAIIYEVLDMGTAITDAAGNLASSGAGIPAFVGVIDKAVMRIIELNGESGEIGPKPSIAPPLTESWVSFQFWLQWGASLGTVALCTVTGLPSGPGFQLVGRPVASRVKPSPRPSMPK